MIRDARRSADVITVATWLVHLGYRVSMVERGAAVLYRRRAGGPIGTVSLRPYASRPLVWRWHVDHYTVRMPTRCYAELGVATPRPYWRPFYYRPDGAHRLELSCLPCELDALAAWLPRWIDCRDRGEAHPEAPVVMSRAGLVANYAWTRAGADMYDAATRPGWGAQ